jgi:hypothetical protein
MLRMRDNVRTFEYDHLDVEHRFSGGKFSLVFAGTKHWRIDVEGHGDLWKIFDYCTLRRWPYLREATGSMPGAGRSDGETVLTKIEIHDITPREASTTEG